MNYDSIDTMYFAPDCTHPTVDGYEICADMLYAACHAVELPEPGTIDAFVVGWLYRIAKSAATECQPARRAFAKYAMWYEACERIGRPVVSA